MTLLNFLKIKNTLYIKLITTRINPNLRKYFRMLPHAVKSSSQLKSVQNLNIVAWQQWLRPKLWPEEQVQALSGKRWTITCLDKYFSKTNVVKNFKNRDTIYHISLKKKNDLQLKLICCSLCQLKIHLVI